jgi:hypothetical protein
LQQFGRFWFFDQSRNWQKQRFGHDSWINNTPVVLY